MEIEMDRLSALPDDLLIRILGCLDVKQAASTSLLSKRWRFVWTDLPSLRFMQTTKSHNTDVDGALPSPALELWQVEVEGAQRLKTDVDGALRSRRGAALEYLSLDFIYKYFMASSVDEWVELAAKNNAQRLKLSLRYGSVGIAKPYTLHHTMYSNSWLKALSLYHCIMPPPTPTAAVEWRSMTKISLRSCMVPQQVIGHIVSGCPALRSLSLKWCCGFNRLEIGGRRFRSLLVHVAFDQHGLLEISAPYMRHLDYVGDPGTGTLRLTNAVSLEIVSLRFHPNAYDDLPYLDVIITNAYQIFHTIRCATSLGLQDDTLKVLSMMATNGKQLPQFKAEYLKIDAYTDELNIHGAILILESSPFLERLRICGLPPLPYNEEAIELDPTTWCNLNCDLLHLKSVKIGVYVDMENSWKSTFKLAQTLLKRAPILKEMEIYISEQHKTASTDFKDLIEKFETLLSYPRSSYEVRIVIR